VYLAIAILGLKYYYMISLQLLDLLNRSERMKNVVRSVTRPIKELAVTALALYFLIFIYTMFGFYFLAPLWMGDCSTLFSCYVSTLDNGLFNGGGIANFIARVPQWHPLWIPQLVYDMTFYVVIVVLGLNIVFGIVIDTFGSLREEYGAKIEDMTSVCFICNIESDVFDKYGEGWEAHVKGAHNMWNYLFFMIYISEKDPSDRNGVEDYVGDCIDQAKIEFFPTRRSLSLQGKGVLETETSEKDEDNDNSATKEILEKLKSTEQLSTQLDQLKAMMQKITSEMEREKRKSVNLSDSEKRKSGKF